jgi:hypothetical protein
MPAAPAEVAPCERLEIIITHATPLASRCTGLTLSLPSLRA